MITSTSYQTPATSREGNKPSVLDAVIMVGAQDTPVLSKIGSKKTVKNISHSWIIDRFPDAMRNPGKEIDSFGISPKSTKQKLTNAVEIFKRPFGVSWDQEAIAIYGDGTEMAHEAQKAAVGHAKDMEMAILGIGRSSLFDSEHVRTSDTDPGIMAGIFHYLTLQESAFDPDGVRGNIIAFDSNKDTTGTDTAVTMDAINRILAKIYENGGEAKDIFLGSDLKNSIDKIFTRQWKNEKDVIVNVTKMDTPYGVVNVNLHRMFNKANGLHNVILAGDFSYANFGELHSRIETEATTQTAHKKLYYTSGTLEVRNAFAFAAGFGLK